MGSFDSVGVLFPQYGGILNNTPRHRFVLHVNAQRHDHSRQSAGKGTEFGNVCNNKQHGKEIKMFLGHHSKCHQPMPLVFCRVSSYPFHLKVHSPCNVLPGKQPQLQNNCNSRIERGQTPGNTQSWTLKDFPLSFLEYSCVRCIQIECIRPSMI